MTPPPFEKIQTEADFFFGWLPQSPHQDIILWTKEIVFPKYVLKNPLLLYKDHSFERGASKTGGRKRGGKNVEDFL